MQNKAGRTSHFISSFKSLYIYSMQDLKSKQPGRRTVFWVCDLKELLFLLDTIQLSEGRTVYSVSSPEWNWLKPHTVLANTELWTKTLYSPCMQSLFTSSAETVKYGACTSTGVGDLLLFYFSHWSYKSAFQLNWYQTFVLVNSV